MKMLVVFVLLTAMPLVRALACPQMEGEYSCPDPRGGVTRVEIDQNGNEFTLHGLDPLDHLVADGQWQRVQDSNYYRNARYLAKCQDQRILANVQGDVYQGSFYTGKANIQVSLEKLANGDMKRAVKGTIQGPFMQIPVSDQGTCRFVK